MTFICLWNRRWNQPLDRIAASALKVVPRVAVDSGKGVVWADGKSLELTAICHDLESVIAERASIGASVIPIAAEVAARFRGNNERGSALPRSPAGKEREFLRRNTIGLLDPSPP